MKLAPEIIERAKKWTTAAFDGDTQAYIRAAIDENNPELEDAFYRDLEFGTGGMRGIMGLGTNRINQYTLGMATQGLCNYLKTAFPGEQLKVAIAYDCRNNSQRLAGIVADVFSANNVEVYLYEDLRVTPQLSWTIRHLGCHSGIVLTASHNPKEYNGYKVYWSDGAQIVPPHDKKIIEEVQKISSPEEVKFERNPSLVHLVGEELDALFTEAVLEQSVSKLGIEDLKIAFTSLHGTSITAIPRVLEAAGFKRVFTVAEQATPDGNFPTVNSPNPEEPEALKMALDLAKSVEADLVVGTDPDGDRIGLAARNSEGENVLLNGNQTGALLTWFLLERRKEQNQLPDNAYVASTIVTSDLIIDIAAHFGVDCAISLTGFKWIANIIREREQTHTFIGGGEESYGYMIGDFVRDKDSVTSTLIACELAAWAKSQGKTVLDMLDDIYRTLGLYRERLVYLVKKGKEGAQAISDQMVAFRENPPSKLGAYQVIAIDDVKTGIRKDLGTLEEKKLNLPSSNVLQFHLEGGGKVSVRPSGTEPKIKFYISLKEHVGKTDNLRAMESELDQKINEICEDLGL
jgi:phosphoglucomutase